MEYKKYEEAEKLQWQLQELSSQANELIRAKEIIKNHTPSYFLAYDFRNDRNGFNISVSEMRGHGDHIKVLSLPINKEEMLAFADNKIASLEKESIRLEQEFKSL